MHSTISDSRATDLLQSFLIDRSRIRGKLVRLSASVDTILRQHANPEPVSRLLAEMLIVVSMLSSNLKAEGVLTLQASGDGPVRFIVVDTTHDGHLRGYAELDPECAFTLHHAPSLTDLFGEGRLAITLDQGGDGGRYQGIVELKGEHFSEAIHEYFTQSQQVEMALTLCVRTPEGPRGSWNAAGILIERVPQEGGGTPLHTALKPGEETEEEDNEEKWWRTRMLMETLRDEELLDPALSSWALLERLFHEDGVWAYPLKSLTALCRCSRARVAGILRTLPLDELNEMLVDGILSVNCRFCNSVQEFSAGEVARIHEA